MMSERDNHIEWSTLNDYVDDALIAEARHGTARHLEECAQCRETLERLRGVLSTASAASGEIAPPPEAWGAIRAEIEAKKVVAIAPPSAPRSPLRHRSPLAALRFTAAAVVLVAASSAITVAVMNRSGAPTSVAAVPDSGAPGVISVSLPADFANAERGYLTTVDELSATLNEARATLAPETVRAVERNLKIIDEAIAEARAALANDPSNFAVRDLLKKGYEQKVDFLRRATARYLTS